MSGPAHPATMIGRTSATTSEVQVTESPDPVNHPPHYKASPSGVEVIQVTEHLGFCLGNVVKYVLRADHKGQAIEDLRKANFYLVRELRRRGYDGEI